MELSELNLHIYTCLVEDQSILYTVRMVYNIGKGVSHFKLDILNSLSLTTCPMSPCTTSMVAFELVRKRERMRWCRGKVCS